MPKISLDNKRIWSSLTDYSKVAAKLLAPIFGKDCQWLNRNEAFCLAEAATYAVRYEISLYHSLEAGDIDAWKEIFKHKLAPGWTDKAIKALSRLQLDEIDLLALAEFLHRELRLGRWSLLGQGQTVSSLAVTLGYVFRHLGNNQVAIGDNKEITHKGSPDYILAILEYEEQWSYVPTTKSSIIAIQKVAELAHTVNETLRELGSLDDELSKDLLLTQEEKEIWGDSIVPFLFELSDFCNLLALRRQQIEAGEGNSNLEI